jgi:hypothetical protein
MTLIQLHRDLTVVKIGDGQNTCFWLDSWLDNKPLSIQYPALFSHVRNPNTTVAEAYTGIGWQLRLNHITSQRAENEMLQLLDRIANVELNEESDLRYMRFGPEKHFSVKGCYYALNFGGVTCSGNSEIWNSWPPKKCKVFAWLTLHNRLNTRGRLAQRGVITDATCPFGCPREEILTHLLFQCFHTSYMWRKFQIQNTQAIQNVQDAITNPRHMLKDRRRRPDRGE